MTDLSSILSNQRVGEKEFPIFYVQFSPGGVQGGREGSIISFNSYTKCGEMDVKEISTIFIEKHRKSVLQFNFDSFLHYTRA